MFFKILENEVRKFGRNLPLATFGSKRVKIQALVVQRLDNAIHRINHYPVDSAISFPNTYPLDSDLSGGYHYPTFEQPGPEQEIFTYTDGDTPRVAVSSVEPLDSTPSSKLSPSILLLGVTCCSMKSA